MLFIEQIDKLSENLKDIKKPYGNADIKDWNIKVVSLEKSKFQLNLRYQELQSENLVLKDQLYAATCCKDTLKESNGMFFFTTILFLKRSPQTTPRRFSSNLVICHQIASFVVKYRRFSSDEGEERFLTVFFYHS